jgi:N-acetylglucosaminyldiphosphoundecaprenol N-acetyl-beta-D-mannosaminyltransferase
MLLNNKVKLPSSGFDLLDGFLYNNLVMANILGVKISGLDKKGVTEALRSYLESNRQHYVVTPNPEFVVAAQKQEDFLAIINEADLAICDGVGLQYAARFLGQEAPPRITGNDLMQILAGLCAESGQSMFLLGGEDEDSGKKAAAILKDKFPTLKVQANPGGPIFFKDGQWSMNPAVLRDIVNSEPAVLLVALGHGKQERWIISFLQHLPSVRVAAGIGGAFDYLSGSVPRAPRWMRRLGLEWLYRLIKQPTRIKRIWTAVMVFPYLVIKSKIRSI